MNRLKDLRHPATLLSIVAVVVASGGVSYAAAKIGSAQISDNSIQSRDVRDGTLGTRDLSRSARTALAGEDGNDGATGPAGPKGDPGAPGANGATGAAGAKGDKGDPGTKGDKGDQGAAGPSSVITQYRPDTQNFTSNAAAVFSVPVQPGSYSVAVSTLFTATAARSLTCTILAPTEKIRMNAFFGSGGGVDGLSTVTAFDVATATDIKFNCETDGSTGSPHLEFSTIVITKVGSVTRTDIP